MSIKESIVRSAIWSAYGDALGFITELTDKKGLKHRAGSLEIRELTNWTRKIGGLSGTFVDFPAGIYSDDTQLRLATSRAINADGYFDVEAFAKIELPVWLSYCLGAGRGTKAAASNLIRNDINWFSNFYRDKNLDYFQSGGNGAVMRIQPHVWGNLNSDVEGVLLDVFRNSICTHGHPRGILGACFHALFLLHVFNHKVVPSIDDWYKIAKNLIIVPDIIEDDMQIATFWKPTWESQTGKTFKEAVKETIIEILDDIRLLETSYNQSCTPYHQYISALDLLGGYDPKQRGSGTKTALLASFLSLLFIDTPQEAMLTAVNQLGSDTDTIATIAGAILGALSENLPNEKLIDQKYIEKEAMRIGDLNSGTTDSEFSYPDLFGWQAPKRLSDALDGLNDKYMIKGLGVSRSIGKPLIIGKKESLRWLWIQTSYGQTCLIRIKEKLPEINGSIVNPKYVYLKDTPIKDNPKDTNSLQDTQQDLLTSQNPNKCVENNQPVDIETLTMRTINLGLKARDIGNDIRKMLDDGRTIEELVAYTAIISKADKNNEKG
ncbi:ADP-ribosylglycohydrolase family protein [Neptunomonas japonica]|uniref:ADP-ribosylglycohydrolase family protein n=1 Tax=Neptunomonas japonica TaxID=417574 RepID=UPI00041D7180|nr:ADP-ribosylglycohydrolase family protein [Neptunomonas japonica]